MRKQQLYIAFILLTVAGSVSYNGYTQPQFQAVPNDPLEKARMYADMKQYDKAAEVYEKIYKQNPSDQDVYRDYFQLLLVMKDFKKAEKILDEQLSIRRNYPLLFVDAGRLYQEQGKTKKAESEFDKVVLSLNGDDLITQRVASAFFAIGRDDYALKTYERARDILHNGYLYSGPLARLYAKQGDMYKSVGALLEGGVNYQSGLEDIKATLLEVIGADPKKIQATQKALVKKINEQPENSYYPELLTWIYTQKDDWEGALIQIEAIDARNKESGERVLEFARFAAKENQYDYALKAYDIVINKGAASPFSGIAKGEKLSVRFAHVQQHPDSALAEIQVLSKDYESYLTEFPQYYNSQTLRDYAALEAQYANNPQKGIDLLEKALNLPNVRRDFLGVAKLQLGDYYVIQGKVWDASLLYSQVDKTFKEDMLGEEARFRNAKLAYYRGDFEWAQGQLTVLKASTSELISNDALYLSVLITENIPPDSNYVPLTRFAYADLLMFQNKDKEAEAIFDSISKNFPKHPLQDDILMQHAKLSQKHRDYKSALTYLKEVYEKHGDDVLGDDAVFKTAEIYHKHLSQPEKAKEFYEKLIIDYPGSTYVLTARAHLKTLEPEGQIVP